LINLHAEMSIIHIYRKYCTSIDWFSYSDLLNQHFLETLRRRFIELFLLHAFLLAN